MRVKSIAPIRWVLDMKLVGTIKRTVNTLNFGKPDVTGPGNLCGLSRLYLGSGLRTQQNEERPSHDCPQEGKHATGVL